MNNNLDENGLNEKEFLEKYNPKNFENISLTVDIVIFSIDNEKQKENYRKLDDQKLKILLVKRKEHPYINYWSLPGGFVKTNESLEETANRILLSKTGLNDLYIEQLYTFGGVSRDPRMRIISSSYISLIDRSKHILKQTDLVSESDWFEIDFCGNKLKLTSSTENFEIDFAEKVFLNGKMKNKSYEIKSKNEIAFDHAKIILEGLLRLRNKIEYTDIVFNLVPDKFSLTQLQQVYEMILGEKLLAAAFRRKIANKIKDTGEYSKEKGHRPSQYYVYKEK